MVQATDLVWHGSETVSHASIDEYYYDNFTSTRHWGEVWAIVEYDIRNPSGNNIFKKIIRVSE